MWSLFYSFVHNRLFIWQEMGPGPSNQSGLRFISGIICKSKALRFERMLFRATRGNMLFNQATADEHIMDPVSTEMVFLCLITTYFFILFLLLTDKDFYGYYWEFITPWRLLGPFALCFYWCTFSRLDGHLILLAFDFFYANVFCVEC